MEATLAALANRLDALMGNASFRSDFNVGLSSPEKLMAIGEHNITEYEKFVAMNDDGQERFDSLTSNILASVLQAEAIKSYGSADGLAIRQFLYDWHNEPETMAFWEKFIEVAKLNLSGLGPTKEQLRIMNEFIDALPSLVIETIIELIQPTRLLPRAEAHSISVTLADMLKESKSCYQ
ncbi:hypothetical protein ACFLTS_07535 [Chloroflexota bacterium]